MAEKLSADVFFIRYRYHHHSLYSGYDQICNYLGSTLELPGWLDFAGNTVLRLPAKMLARKADVFCYGRKDVVLEAYAAYHIWRHRRKVYHFVYAEKSFRYIRVLGKGRDNILVGSFHHAPHQYPVMVRHTDHFKRLKHAVVLSTLQIPFLETILGKGNVSFIPHGVITDVFKPPDTRVPGPLRCLFVGYHMRDFKNLPRIVDGILDQHRGVEIHLVSKNPVCKTLGEKDRVFQYDRLSDDEYLAMLQKSDLLILPLLGSTFVTTVLESLSCGVPIVASEGGISDYIDRSSGELVPVGDTDTFIHVCTNILGNDSKRHAMSAAARQRALHFSWYSVAEKLKELYQKLL
ncbi:glycosyltransferase family 4 protein [bacterium]|nr:glycosyltransferase family 4 protein [candidate division CSSED10-310 bacterium]